LKSKKVFKSPNEIWNEIENFLRKHGYKITKEELDYFIPLPKRALKYTKEQFYNIVAFYIHEAVELEEVKRKIGKFPKWEDVAYFVVEKYPETHLKAIRLHKLYFKEKGVPIPKFFGGK
jgi:hypothetical protein